MASSSSSTTRTMNDMQRSFLSNPDSRLHDRQTGPKMLGQRSARGDGLLTAAEILDHHLAALPLFLAEQYDQRGATLVGGFHLGAPAAPLEIAIHPELRPQHP